MSQKKKILIVSFNFPHPVNNGGAIAQSFFLDRLQSEFEVSFASVIKTQADVRNFNKRFPSIQVFNLYEPGADQGTSLFFRTKLYASRFLNRVRKKKPVQPVQDHLELDYIRNLVNLKTNGFVGQLDRVIKINKFEIIQFDFFETLDLAVLMPAGASTVFVSHELRSKRIRLASEHSNTSTAYKNYLFDITSAYEYELLKRFDRVVVFNADDQQILESEGINVSVSPYGIPSFMHVRQQPSDRFDKFIFIGGESHFPNKEGLTWFIDTIFLNLKAPHYPLHIIGEWSPEFKLRYAPHNNIRFAGAQEEIYPIFDNAILIAPILSGAGLR
ncbi:MAG: hypothetical protein EOO02_21940, partial [Chitinophagaceae bacterium]